jgi:hypothetical protein
MELQRQIQLLLQEAPQDGQTPQIVQVIAPVLLELAQRLKYTEYNLLQSLDQRWQVTTLQHRNQQNLEKSVIYAFGSAKDATNAGNRQLLVTAKPVIQLLFQLLALEGVDSLIFMDTPGDQNKGIEIQRQELQELVRVQLQQLNVDLDVDHPLPSDFA